MRAVPAGDRGAGWRSSHAGLGPVEDAPGDGDAQVSRQYTPRVRFSDDGASPSPPYPRPMTRGFTLIELAIAIVVAAVLLAAALPRLRPALDRVATASAAHEVTT